MPQFYRLIIVAILPLLTGCSLVPEGRNRDVLHNPFPQLKRVAVLPFFNQSGEPTVNGELVAEKYYTALQAIPGFEVLPIGVTKAQYVQYSMQFGEPATGQQFQTFAKMLGVEAIVVGSVTDFDMYYPPRMAMTVHWYAANEGFHPIPAGYGLPWGTDAEKQIPRRIAREAEFELARSQLATQTPEPDPNAPIISPSSAEGEIVEDFFINESLEGVPADPMVAGEDAKIVIVDGKPVWDNTIVEAPTPPDWPDPTDLIPDPPSPTRPSTIVNHEPVLSHTRIFHGDDPYFTGKLSDFVETGDDARSSGWQGYLRRTDDFIRFCCHLHITEMLESRGGRDQSEFILRWPLSRY